MGREALPEERTRSSMQMQKLAESKGWLTKIGYSKFQDDDKTFKTGAKAGTTIEGKVIDNVWCQGIKEGHVFTVVWENNKLYNVMYDNQISSLKELKEKL
jgi:hypothetical protein